MRFTELGTRLVVLSLFASSFALASACNEPEHGTGDEPVATVSEPLFGNDQTSFD